MSQALFNYPKTRVATNYLTSINRPILPACNYCFWACSILWSCYQGYNYFPESYSLPTETVRGAFHLTRMCVGCVDARSATSAFVDLLTFQHFCLFVLELHTVFRAGCYKVSQQVPEIRESLRKELQVACTSFGHAHTIKISVFDRFLIIYHSCYNITGIREPSCIWWRDGGTSHTPDSSQIFYMMY